MATPRQMTAHTLEAIKGWPSPHAVDFAAKLSANVTLDPVYAGRVAHLVTNSAVLPGWSTSTVEYELGLPSSAGAANMPIFLFQNSDDPDVSNPGGNPATEAGVWVAVSPTGKIMGLVAAGAYELESTEFEPEATAGVYAPGQGLTAETEADAQANQASKLHAGRLIKAAAYDKPLCGVVSRGVRKNSHGVNALAFWPVWLPANNAGA